MWTEVNPKQYLLDVGDTAKNIATKWIQKIKGRSSVASSLDKEILAGRITKRIGGQFGTVKMRVEISTYK
jgi:hypothetical protein